MSKNNTHNFSEEEKEKILSVALKNMVMIDGKVYGLEDDSEPEVFVDCLSKLSSCRAVCCSYVFGLTQEEVRKGLYRYNPSRPYYTAKDEDGFCPYLDRDGPLREAVRKAKQEAKTRFAAWLKSTRGQEVDPDTIFDTQIKHIHEYKRQLLNALHIVVLYHRLRTNPKLSVPARTFFFAGKAAPAYRLAKLVIKFINNVAATIDRDPAVKGRLKVVFVPDYRVSVAERLIPGSDVSEQISTAGYEASGTSNMKFMMNGALTIGTRDGATIEMAEAAGEENFFLFGLTAEQVTQTRGFYSPQWHYVNDPETRAALGQWV